MSILTFLGTMDFNDCDDYGTIHLKLVLDVLSAIKQHEPEDVIEEKARNIIRICCDPMFENMIFDYRWDLSETEYAEDLLDKCIELATWELLDIVHRRITHKRKYEYRTKLRVEDMKLAAVMAFVMSVDRTASIRLEEMFIKEHGEMNFNPQP